MAKSMLVLIVAIIALQQFIVCEAAELGEQKKEGELKQAESRKEKPDFFLIWLDPYQQFLPDQVKDMLDSQVRPQTQQMTEQMMNMPGAKEAYQALSQYQEFLSSLMNQAGGSSPFGRRRLRRLKAHERFRYPRRADVERIEFARSAPNLKN